MTFRITFTYVNISDRDLPLKALGIADSVAGNANFPNAGALVTNVRTKALDFQDSLSIALLGDERSIALKNQKREDLRIALHELAGHVMVVAKNNPDVLTSSGFDITKAKASSASDSLSIRTSTDTPGQAISTMKTVPNARVYFHQYTPDPLTADSVWTEVMVTRRKHTWTGLTPGTRYWFRARVLDRDGQEIFTDHLLRMVQ